MQTAYYKLRAVPQDGERLAKEKTLVNQGETGEKAEKKGGNAVYILT